MDEEIFELLNKRRTVGRLRQKFEDNTSSPPQPQVHNRFSLPASRFAQALKPAESIEGNGHGCAVSIQREFKSVSSLSANHRPDRYSRVTETVKFFENNDNQQDVVQRRGPTTGLREFGAQTKGNSEFRSVEVTSSSTVSRSQVRTTKTTTVYHSTIASPLRPNRRIGDEVKLRRTKAFDDSEEECEEAVYDNPAVDEDGDEKIVLRMKEDERAYDRRTRYQSVFKEVPLYQSYSKDVIRRESWKASKFRHARLIDSDTFDDIPAIDESPIQSIVESSETELGGTDNDAGIVSDRLSAASNSGTFDEGEESESVNVSSGHEPLTRMLAGSGPQRTFWADTDEVKRSGVLETMDEIERNLEELQFEVITSEASYFRSLEILVSEFYKAPEFDPSNHDAVLTLMQKVHLFSNILRIHEMSENFLTDLETVWQESPTNLSDVTRIVFEHSEKHFKDYVPYIRNQIYMNKALAQLDMNEKFKEVVRKIQLKAECGSIWDFRSFILLPMQRVTRLKLLMDKMLESMTKGNIPESDRRYVQSLQALGELVKVLEDAETQRDMMTQKERLVTLSNQLDWATGKSVSISDKKLVKEGKLRLLFAEKSMKKRSFFSSKPLFVYLFLFNDLLVVTKMKNNSRYSVIDHCPRQALTAQMYPQDSNSNSKFPFEVELLENHSKSRERFRLDVDTETERERWLSALCPSLNRDETQDRVYDEYDCPQMLVTRCYNARQPDELNLKDGELYSVQRKTADVAICWEPLKSHFMSIVAGISEWGRRASRAGSQRATRWKWRTITFGTDSFVIWQWSHRKAQEKAVSRLRSTATKFRVPKAVQPGPPLRLRRRWRQGAIANDDEQQLLWEE